MPTKDQILALPIPQLPGTQNDSNIPDWLRRTAKGWEPSITNSETREFMSEAIDRPLTPEQVKKVTQGLVALADILEGKELDSTLRVNAENIVAALETANQEVFITSQAEEAIALQPKMAVFKSSLHRLANASKGKKMEEKYNPENIDDLQFAEAAFSGKMLSMFTKLIPLAKTLMKEMGIHQKDIFLEKF